MHLPVDRIAGLALALPALGLGLFLCATTFASQPDLAAGGGGIYGTTQLQAATQRAFAAHDAALMAADAAGLARHLAAIERGLRLQLARTPANGALWASLAEITARRTGDTRAALPFYDLSYLTGRIEDSAVSRRLVFATARWSELPAGSREHFAADLRTLLTHVPRHRAIDFLADLAVAATDAEVPVRLRAAVAELASEQLKNFDAWTAKRRVASKST
ncbi:MAG: hypothetical protein R3D33_01395 [Hyphomicrobiaceae bacterium]